MTKNKQAGIPDYRVAAFASLDLKEHMEAHPDAFQFGKQAQKIDWKVQQEKGYYVAEGVLSIPVKMFFTAKDDKEDSLTVERVVCSGKRIYDSRVDDEDEKDPNYGMDVDSARVESFARYQSNISK